MNASPERNDMDNALIEEYGHPGELRAIEHGCSCDIVLNNYGRGITQSDGTIYFVAKADCTIHGDELDEPEEQELCDTCAGARWGTSVPMAGIILDARGHVEACDTCGLFGGDEEAAEALAFETDRVWRLNKPGGDWDGGRVRYHVPGYAWFLEE